MYKDSTGFSTGFGKIPGSVQILDENYSGNWRRLHSYRENMSSASIKNTEVPTAFANLLPWRENNHMSILSFLGCSC